MIGVDIRSAVWREVTTEFEVPAVNKVRHPVSWTRLDKLEQHWRMMS